MLNSKQRSYLRGEANELDPIIHVGKEGVTKALLEHLEEALDDHELLKGRVLDNAPRGVKEMAHILAEETGADVVQVIGGIFVLYRPNPEDPYYELP